MFIKGFYVFDNGYTKETHECWINKDHIIAISNSDTYKDSYYLHVINNDISCRSYYIKKTDMDPILETSGFSYKEE